jgi:hypothetical protein
MIVDTLQKRIVVSIIELSFAVESMDRRARLATPIINY